MKKLFKQIELKKVEKLVNNKDSVLFTSGNEIEYIYNKKTNKRYYPKYNVEIER